MSSLVGMSPMTIKAYRKGLVAFYRCVGDVLVHELKYEHIKKFLNDLEDRELSSYTKRLYVGDVKRFLVFNGREDLTKKIKNPKLAKSERDHISFAYWDDFIEASGSDRSRAIVSTLLSTGMRLTEARGIKIDNIDWNEGRIKVRAKGGDMVYYYMLTDDIRQHLKPYVAGRSAGYAFPGVYKGGCISERYVEGVVKKAAIKANVPKAEKISPHCLRHSLANYLLMELRWDLKVIQQVLNHKNIATTSLYTNATPEELTRFIKENRTY